MSKKGGGGGGVPVQSTTTTTQTAPWVGQQPYLTFGFQQAQNLYNQGGPQYYPGPTVAPVSPETSQALDLLAQRAAAGSPLTTAAQNADLATASGAFLGAANPYFQQLLGNVANAVAPRITGSFEGAGRYGSGAYANALASALTDTAGNLAYQNYANERRNMTQAAALAPSLADQDYTNLQELASVGDARQQLAQQQINAAIDRYNYDQNLPYNNLANYMRMVQGNYGNSATQTTQTAVNPLAGALGLGRSGFDPFSSLINTLLSL
ncbi:MAG TPA: hypothetical protein VFA50_13190 [Stellaceae bacterium]|nr:hypothetical protein [Stellaceae bacterium]